MGQRRNHPDENGHYLDGYDDAGARELRVNVLIDQLNVSLASVPEDAPANTAFCAIASKKSDMMNQKNTGSEVRLAAGKLGKRSNHGDRKHKKSARRRPAFLQQFAHIQLFVSRTV